MLKKAHLSLSEGKQTKDGSRLFLRLLLPKWRSALGFKQLLCCIRRFQKLGFYWRCFVLIALTLVLLAVYFFSPLSSSPGWVPSDSCVAPDCTLQDPLSYSELSPNLLLVLIHASARNKETRDNIRNTWLSALNNRANTPIQYRFVVGGMAIPPDITEKITKEVNEYKDMLIFPTITDSKDSLTNRTLFSFKYAQEFFNFKYVMKCDDDTFVDLPRIGTELQLRTSVIPLYWGYMNGNAEVFTSEKFRDAYIEHLWYVCDTYTPYALGGGYILSSELIKILADNLEHLKRYTCEDVSIGAWLAPYNIELKHDARFNVNVPSRGCKDPYLISHKVLPEQMEAYYESLVLEGKICSWRTYGYVFREFNGYVFNWSDTSKCCVPNSYIP